MLSNAGLPSQVDTRQTSPASRARWCTAKNMFEILHDGPATRNVHSRPPEAVPSQGNKHARLDLAPWRRFAECTLAQGVGPSSAQPVPGGREDRSCERQR